MSSECVLYACRLQRRLPAHPNIVRVVDAFETPDEIVAVAEFVPGELHKQFDVYKASMSGSDKNSKGLPESREAIQFNQAARLGQNHKMWIGEPEPRYGLCI